MDLGADTFQNSCGDCTSVHHQHQKALEMPMEDTANQRSATPRPDHLPLKERGHAIWSSPGSENALPTHNVSCTAKKSSDVLCPDSKTVFSAPEQTSKVQHISTDTDDHHSSTSLSRAPLSFTNPLHSDDSDTEEKNSGALTKSLSNISTASATVSAVSTYETPTARKVLPMSIARHDVPEAEKDFDVSEDSPPPPLPERTPEAFELANEQKPPSPKSVLPVQAAEWSSLQDLNLSEQTQPINLKTSGCIKFDNPGRGDGRKCDLELQLPLVSSMDTKGQLSESSLDVSDLGKCVIYFKRFCNF